ncbi:MAG: PAS domain S-box protein [Desulfomonile tiedjei]|nr:PAS domain S-box protein [Desulfomonile tiedjei]
MTDREKTKDELVLELERLRHRVAELEACATEHKWLEEALQQSETKFRKLTEKSVVGVYLVQEDLFRYVNPRLAWIFGYDVEELINKKGPRDLVYPEDWPAVEENLKKRFSGQVEAISFQFRGVRRDGETIYTEVYGSRADYNGRPAVLGTLLDVTQRIRAQHELQTELNKFQALFDLAVAMTAERSLDENLSLVVEKSRELLRADTAFIALRDEKNGDLFMHTLSGIQTADFRRIRIPFGKAHGGTVAKTGERSSLEDYFQEVEPLLHGPVRAEGLISGIAVPIKIAQTNLGVLYVYNRTKTRFSASDLDTLSLMGNLAALEITRNRAKESLLESQERYRNLYEKAKKAQDRYRSLLNASPDPIVVYDAEGKPTYINEAHTKVFGWTFEQLAGSTIPYVPPENWPETSEMIETVRRGERFSGQATRRYTKDGRVIDVNVSGAPFFDHQGHLAGFFVILRDRTDSTRAEEARRRNEENYRVLYEESRLREELYRSVLNSSADAIVIYDMEGRAEYTNPSFTRIFGWELEELQGRKIPFMPDTEVESSLSLISSLIAEGTPVSGFETRRYTKDGRLLYISISGSRYHDHDGRPVGMLAILRDISDYKITEEALRRSEENYRALYAESERLRKHYRTLLDASPEPIVVYDVEGLPQYINPAFTRVFGWTFPELEGKRIDFVPPENWPETRKMIEMVLHGEAFSDEESRRYTRDGRIIDVSVSGAIFFDEAGNRTGSVVHLRDITARKQAEANLAEELQKFQVLYELAVAMRAERSLDENLSLLVNKSRELLAADKAFLALRDETTGDLYMHTVSGIVTEAFRNLRIPVGVGLGGKVAESGQWLMVEDYFKEVGPEFHEVARGEGLFSGIAVPVVVGQTNLGVLYAFNRTRTSFSRPDLDTLSLLGNLAAVEITRKRVQERLVEREESFKNLYEESKLREELYRALLNSSADAIVIYDMEGKTQYVSPSFTRTFGWTLEEVEGKRIPFLPETEREATMAIIRRIIGDGTPCSAFETKRLTKDGRILDISISASRNRDHEGKPVGTLAILRDITDRKKAEAALKESEERFRTLADVAPIGLVVLAADERTEYVNPKFTEIFGYTLEDLPDAESWFRAAYMTRESAAKAASIWRTETADIQIEYGIGTEASPRVFTAVCKDGSPKIASFRSVVLADGRVIATFLDVTAEMKAQEEIVRAKNEWERTFNAVSDLILILDQDRRIVRVNRALADRLGVPPESFIGALCAKGSGEERTPLALCPDTRSLAVGNEYSAEVSDENLGGVFDLRVSPLTDENSRVIGSVNVARDVTAFKSMERARRRAVHHLSHELKTPLAVIKSSLKNLTSTDLPDDKRDEKLERIQRNLGRLTHIQHIVQEIVTPRAYQPRSFPLIPTVNEIISKSRRRASHRDVDLVARLEPVETDVIDPEIFGEILATLLKNAVENTPDEGEVIVYLTRVPSGVLLQVEDRGVGIPAADREFLFKAFYHTQATSRYATKNPFDFDAGGKGLELMRLKILSEDGYFDISFESRQCQQIRDHLYECPGKISLCRYVSGTEECKKSGGTTFSVLFHPRPKG